MSIPNEWIAPAYVLGFSIAVLALRVMAREDEWWTAYDAVGDFLLAAMWPGVLIVLVEAWIIEWVRNEWNRFFPYGW